MLRRQPRGADLRAPAGWSAAGGRARAVRRTNRHARTEQIRHRTPLAGAGPDEGTVGPAGPLSAAARAPVPARAGEVDAVRHSAR
jgi:hypothetical protein